MRQLLPLHVAVDVAAQLAADADVLSRSFHVRGMAGAQPRLPKPLNTLWGRWKEEKTKRKKRKRLMRRSRWTLHPSSSMEPLNSSKCHHHRHRCLTSPRLWLLRLSGCSA